MLAMDLDGCQECRLCLSTGLNYTNLFDESEHNVYVAAVINEHFGELNITADQLPKFICDECWNKTENFHIFHRSVQSAQSNYLMKFVKTEFNETDPHFDENIDDIKLPSFIEVTQILIDDQFQDEPKIPVKPRRNKFIIDLKVDPVSENEEHNDKNRQILDELPPKVANFDNSCDVCGIDLVSLDKAIMHYKQIHNNVNGYIKCCGKRIYKESTVRDHIKYHADPDIFRCELCGKRLQTKRSYYKHRSWHNAPDNYICDICQRAFNQKDTLKYHMHSRHVKWKKCPHCIARFSTIEEMEAHEKLYHNKEAAIVAKKQLDSLKDLLITAQNATEVDRIVNQYFDLGCDLCDNGCDSTSLQQTQYHYMNEHRVSDGYIKCCNMQFKDQHVVLEHVPYHVDEEICRCKVCGKQMNMVRRLRSHLEVHIRNHPTEGIHRCKVCNKRFVSESYLKIHMKKNHVIARRSRRKSPTIIGIDMPSVTEYFDMECTHVQCKNIIFSSLQHAKLHYFEVHGNPDGFIRCCGLNFKNNRQIDDHLKFHVNPESFKCEYCNKHFLTQQILTAHVSKHKAMAERRYICELCQKSFACNYSLRMHLSSHRRKAERLKKESKFQCSFCNRRFHTEELRKAHEDRIHSMPSKDKQEICEFCAKRFKAKSDVDAHVRRVHPPSGESRPKYQCKICDTWLTNPYILKTHMLKHTSEPEKCPHCDKMSPNRNALDQHIKKFHFQQRIHKCSLCEKSFKDLTSLKSHVGTHTGEKMYKCSYCPEAFIWRPNMYSHQKKMHPIEWSEGKKQKAIKP